MRVSKGVLTNIRLENNFSADVLTEWELKISLVLFRIYVRMDMS